MRRRWPDYRMYTWAGQTGSTPGAWIPTERVSLATRNYLFATDAALAGPHPTGGAA